MKFFLLAIVFYLLLALITLSAIIFSFLLVIIFYLLLILMALSNAVFSIMFFYLYQTILQNLLVTLKIC